MEIIVFSGIQCSGKSTYYWQYFSGTHLRINLDELKSRKKELALIQSSLEQGVPLVIDNTNPTRKDRSKYIRLGKEFGYRIVGIQFEVPIALALSRSANRNTQKEVPPLDIHLTFRKMQPLSAIEGFDEIRKVSEFKIRPALAIVKS